MRIARGGLKRCEKKLNAKSTASCVKKLIKTRVPRAVYDISYASRNHEKSMGGKRKAEELVKQHK